VARDRLTETSIVKLPPKDAAALFVARNGGEGLNAEEELLLANWLKENVANRREYENAHRVWQTFVNIKGDEIMAAMRAHAATERPKQVVTLRIALVGVAIILVAAAATIFFTSTLNPKTVTVIPYSTLRTQLREEKLPDGSQLDLDADSTIIGRFGPVGRQMDLQNGRALFSVVADRSRTFTVTAGGRSIIAVGTRFDVNLVNGTLIVTLLKGHVVIESMQSDATPVVLEPGQQFIERGGRSTVRSLGADVEDTIAWRTGVAIFADQPLAEAVSIMNRYTQEQFVIKDPALASLPLTGRFRTGDVQGFSSTLAALHHLESVQSGKQIELTRAHE